MSEHPLDREFIERQRARLEALRDQIRATAAGVATASRRLQDDTRGVPGDVADEASNLNLQEIDAGVRRQERRRLAHVERALAKIAEATYGLSDCSGDPIPRARLEARPEALHTVEEEEQLERRQRSGR